MGGAKRWERLRGYEKAVGEEKGFAVSMVVSCYVTLLSLTAVPGVTPVKVPKTGR